MPSTLVVAAVAYGAGTAATAFGVAALGAAVIGAAAAATASTAMNGGSWGENFGMGLLGAGIASGVGALASSAGSAGSLSSGLGSGISEAGSGAIGSGLGDATGSGLGSSLGSSTGAGLEGALGTGLGGASLEGALSPSLGSALGDAGGSAAGTGLGGVTSGMGDSLGSGLGSSGSDALTQGIGNSSVMNSVAAPSSTPTVDQNAGGGMEGFQNNNPFGPTNAVNGSGDLGTGFYNSAPNTNMSYDGSQLTGGFSDLGQSSLPNAGAQVVPDWQKGLQTVQNGLGNLWDNIGSNVTWKTGVKTLGGLYDAYARNKAAQGYQNNLSTMNNMYAPGSAEYTMLQQKLDRQNAAAGRRSQSLNNATNFANVIAQQRNSVISSPSYMANMNAYNQNKWNGLGSIFNVAGGIF